MLLLGIHQHAPQLTVSLRDQQGDVLLARFGSTRLANVLEFSRHSVKCGGTNTATPSPYATNSMPAFVIKLRNTIRRLFAVV